jgi:asparagine synthetase B (glutamine-hydrolysing)
MEDAHFIYRVNIHNMFYRIWFSVVVFDRNKIVIDRDKLGVNNLSHYIRRKKSLLWIMNLK